MESFQVIEMDEGINRAVLWGLSCWRELRGECSAEHPALLAISPKAARWGIGLSRACRTLLLPGQAQQALEKIQAASVVSYGSSSRDSLTVSSCRRKRLSVALQRELVTVEGQVVERQEFPVLRVPGMEMMPNLAVIGTLLLLGVAPEELMEGGSIHFVQ